MIGGADELDEISVRILDDGEGNSAGEDDRAFSEDFHPCLFETFESSLRAVNVNGEVAESERAGDVGLGALFGSFGGLHQLDGGGSLAFTEREFLDDQFFASAEAGVPGDFFAGSEFSGGGEAEGFGVELQGRVEVADNDS